MCQNPADFQRSLDESLVRLSSGMASLTNCYVEDSGACEHIREQVFRACDALSKTVLDIAKFIETYRYIHQTPPLHGDLVKQARQYSQTISNNCTNYIVEVLNQKDI